MDFEKLYTEYADWVYRKCLWYVRSQQDAQDLTHTIFIDIKDKSSSFRGECSEFTWLYRVTMNHCFSWLRRAYRERERTEPFDETLFSAPSRYASSSDQKMDISKIMRHADKKTAQILYLTAMEGLTQEEVAQIIGMTKRALNKRLAAFREKVLRFSGVN
jgi:RNA polymerase sigma-70 factor (ECF subfamily)